MKLCLQRCTLCHSGEGGGAVLTLPLLPFPGDQRSPGGTATAGGRGQWQHVRGGPRRLLPRLSGPSLAREEERWLERAEAFTADDSWQARGSRGGSVRNPGRLPGRNATSPFLQLQSVPSVAVCSRFKSPASWASDWALLCPALFCIAPFI